MTGGAKKHLRRRVGILTGLFAAPVLLLAVLLAVAGRQVTAQRLVDEVEDSLNCRMEVAGVEVKAVRLFPKVTLRGVRIGRRDGWVGRPLAERPPMDTAAVEVRELRLEVGLPGLLFRRLDVNELVVAGSKVEMTIDAEGSSNLVELFQPAPDRAERRRTAGKKSGGALNVEEFGMLARLRGVQMIDGEAEVRIEKTGMLLQLRKAAAMLDEIEVNPAALMTSNEARLRFQGELSLHWDREAGESGGLLAYEGEAAVRLFDPQSADLNPEVTGRLELGEESFLSTRVPPIDRTWEKLGNVADWGMRIGGMPERATFGRGKALAVHYHRERITMREPVSLWVGDWEVAVLAESWLNLADEQHEIDGEVVAGETLSGFLQRGISAALELVPEGARQEVAAEVEELWFQEGRVVARVRSSGELSDPEIDLENAVPDVGEMVEEAMKRHGKEALKGLGKALLEKLGEE